MQVERGFSEGEKRGFSLVGMEWMKGSQISVYRHRFDQHWWSGTDQEKETHCRTPNRSKKSSQSDQAGEPERRQETSEMSALREKRGKAAAG